MRRGLTLIEIIFVIIIIGIISATGAISLHTRTVESDADFIALALDKTRREGIGFDHRAFGGGEITDINERGCITLTKDGIYSSYGYSAKDYRFRSEISGDSIGKKICFDHLGRPSEGNYTNKITSTLEINVTNRKKSVIIKILPISGYVIITKN